MSLLALPLFEDTLEYKQTLETLHNTFEKRTSNEKCIYLTRTFNKPFDWLDELAFTEIAPGLFESSKLSVDSGDIIKSINIQYEQKSSQQEASLIAVYIKNSKWPNKDDTVITKSNDQINLPIAGIPIIAWCRYLEFVIRVQAETPPISAIIRYRHLPEFDRQHAVYKYYNKYTMDFDTGKVYVRNAFIYTQKPDDSCVIM